MKKTVLLLAAMMSNTIYASQPNNDAINQMYNNRVEEMMESTGMSFEKSIDTKSIIAEWTANQARAQLKFSKPQMYHGRISRVLLNNGNADFIIDAGLPSEVTVTLSAYQAWPWKLVGDQWNIGGVQSNLQFAANFDAGSEMYFQCRRVEFIRRIYLVNCLAFPASITK